MTHRKDASSKLDRGRHPALFQRVSRSVPPVVEPSPPRPEVPATSGSIYAAFIEFVQFRPTEIHHREERVRHVTAQVWDYLDSCGFYPEEIRQLQLGIYTTADDLCGYLRSVGFSEAAISESGLVTDERDTYRHDWHGCLIAPLHDERGQIVDVLAVIPTSVPGHPVRYEFARGTTQTDVVAYGLKTAFKSAAGQKNLVLVEDIVEALYLQCRGFTNVAAVGGDGREFSPRRWEELARLGVKTVTLAFGNDATRQRDVREALDHALRARTAPEVFVLERNQLLENETLADVARRHGLEACQKAAATKSLAFHGKNFGWSWSRESAPRNGHTHPTSFHRESYRESLRAEAEKISHPHERAVIQKTITEVDQALYYRHYSQARDVLESRLAGYWWSQSRPEAHTKDVNTVLERLCEEPRRSAIPDHLARYDGNELQAGTVTVLANESVKGRLADLCSRLVTALETRDDQTWVVVCREFSEDVIVLGLIAHMTRRMTTAQGLTFEEIQARLSGRDPLDGYSDKPWLVDEALDRLRRWTDRLQLITETAETVHVGYTIERIAERQSLGGVFFDSLPTVWHFEKSWFADWKPGYSTASMMREFASRLSCAVIAVTPHAVDSWNSVPPETHSTDWRNQDSSPVIREFRDRLAYWIDQEEHAEVRIA